MASDEEVERLKSALVEERRILAAICLGTSPNNTVHIGAWALELADKDTAISKLADPDGSLTISVKPRA